MDKRTELFWVLAGEHWPWHWEVGESATLWMVTSSDLWSWTPLPPCSGSLLELLLHSQFWSLFWITWHWWICRKTDTYSIERIEVQLCISSCDGEGSQDLPKPWKFSEDLVSKVRKVHVSFVGFIIDNHCLYSTSCYRSGGKIHQLTDTEKWRRGKYLESISEEEVNDQGLRWWWISCLGSADVSLMDLSLPWREESIN